MACCIWGISPADFWEMTPAEWWRWHEMRRQRDPKRDYAGHLRDDDAKELYEMMQNV